MSAREPKDEVGLEAIADRIEAGELISEKSMSDREFLSPLFDESWTGPSGTVYPYDPREAYDLDDPKRLGPGGYW